MAILNGCHGSLYWGTTGDSDKIAKVQNASVQIESQALDTTGVGEDWSDYTPGRKSASGTASLLYKEDDAATKVAIKSILNNEPGETPSQGFVMRLYKQGTQQINGTVLVSSQSVSQSVGELTTLSINFVFCGEMFADFG